MTHDIIGAVIEVHKTLGPGLLENDYEQAILYELKLAGYETKTQQKIKVPHKGIILDCQMRYDILVDDLILIKNKSVLKFYPIYEATLLSYMKYLKIPKGILINFNTTNIFYKGQQTFVNEYFAALPD
ncbi:MAG: GxxExxY protein [Paraglaciecola sp.]|jgi:GxxExxY protein